MSSFKPDIFKNLENIGIAYNSPENFMDNKPIEVPALPNPDEVIIAIQKFGASLSKDEKLLYDYAKLVIITSKNIYDSSHLMNIWFEFFLQTLKKLHPEINTKILENGMNLVEDELENLLNTVEEKDNNLLTPVLLGFVEKLL